jgi:hypothetical protein
MTPSCFHRHRLYPIYPNARIDRPAVRKTVRLCRLQSRKSPSGFRFLCMHSRHYTGVDRSARSAR